jgi:hypothetical protein
VSITYPASSQAPAPTPAPAPTGFEAGIVSGSDVVNEARYVKSLAPKVARVEFDIWQSAADLRAAIAEHAANGTRVVLLAGFHATMPTADQARNLAGTGRASSALAAASGPAAPTARSRSARSSSATRRPTATSTATTGTSRPTAPRAREYALRFRDAQQAIQGANPSVGLLAQADDANTGSANWVNGMFDAVPDLASRVAAGRSTPYGPRTKWEPRLNGWSRQTAARGGLAGDSRST